MPTLTESESIELLTKKCTGCHITKPITEFHKHKQGKYGVRSRCKTCVIYSPERKEEKKRYREKNRDALSKKSREYYLNNLDYCRKYRRDYYRKNKEEKKEYDKKYREKNAKKLKEQRTRWQKEKQKNDIQFIIKRRLQTRINTSIRISGGEKRISTIDLLGCSIEFFQNYLSSLFQEGMSFDNYGDWHLDHIKPCSLFDLSKESEQKKCFHYTNIQPLWAKDNLSKGAKYESE